MSPDFSTFEMAYSQSASAWSTVNAIKGAHGQIAVINNILNQHYGTFEGAFTRVGGSVISVPTGWSLAPARDLDFNLGVEGAASGRAQNPVVPEIRANLTLALVAGVGLEGELPGTSVKSHFGVFGGYGNEKRIDAVSTDLIESVPIRKGDLTLLGFEEGLEYAWTDAAEIRYQSQLHLRETLGFSNTAPDKLGIEDTGGHSAFRWRVDSRAKLPSGIQLQVVLGPQPLPIELLPRIWDYANEVPVWPELGTLVGAGLNFFGQDLLRVPVRLLAGFYGGYVGVGLDTVIGPFNLQVGSWGIEGSSAFQVLGQRIWTSSLAIGI